MTFAPHTQGTLGQAMTKRKRNTLPLLLFVVGIVAAVGLAIVGYLESRRTETVVIAIKPVPYGHPITADDLATVELPLHRPAQLAGMTNPAQAIGQYAARELGENDLVQPSMLMASPPDQPVYPNGEKLTANMVPVPFATTTIGPLTQRDRVNIGFNDQNGDPKVCTAAQAAIGSSEPTEPLTYDGAPLKRPYACRIVTDLRVLYVDEQAKVAYVEMTPYQAQVIWALQAGDYKLWGERYGASSVALPAISRLDIGQVTEADMTKVAPTPAPTVSPQHGATVPGADTSLPGNEIGK